MHKAVKNSKIYVENGTPYSRKMRGGMNSK